MEEIKKLIREKLEKINDFCINECKSYCCRKGYLVLKKEEVELICEKNKNELLEKGFLKEMLNGKFSLNLDNCFGGCPQLKDFKCSIHQNPRRPQTCKDFPIFILDNKIKISSRCLAKKENKFFEFEKEAKKLGFEIVDNFFD